MKRLSLAAFLPVLAVGALLVFGNPSGPATADATQIEVRLSRKMPPDPPKPNPKPRLELGPLKIS